MVAKILLKNKVEEAKAETKSAKVATKETMAEAKAAVMEARAAVMVAVAKDYREPTEIELLLTKGVILRR